MYEARVLKTLQGSVGIPKLYWYGVEGEFTCMVQELLGPSLEELTKHCDGKLSLKTTVMLIDQMLNRIEYLHAKHFVHRDIKPENFLMGIRNPN